MNTPDDYIKGRGAQFNTHNRFSAQYAVKEHWEALDADPDEGEAPRTTFTDVYPKTIVNKVKSPDIGPEYSMNPYQGCEHGCIYCYARNSHQYWGYSAGLDFETRILVKRNAPELLEEAFSKPNWEVLPIMLSGNTDCYQPVERQLGITRKILEVFVKYRHPVGIITKNTLIARDLDLLQELNAHDLVHVSLTITSLNEHLRLQLEPRTAAIPKKLQTLELLAKSGIPVNVMMAPVIPGLNSHEIPALVKEVAARGASAVNYTVVRLNGSIADIFNDWVRKTYPDRADKVLNQIAECHSGQLNDSQFGRRMRGHGQLSEHIAALFRIARRKYLAGRSMKPYKLDAFIRNRGTAQLELF